MKQEPEDDLRARIQSLLEGTLDPDEVVRLDAELRESREARALYLQYASLLSALEEQASSHAAIAHVPVIPIERLLARQRKRMMRNSLLAAAAVILISAVGFWLKMAAPHAAPVASFRLGPDSSFMLSHADGDKAPQAGNTLSAGSRLRMTHGTMEAEFASGVRCVIEAPCDISVLADDRLAMAEGLAWFEVPPQAVGFTVETPRLTVVDLGTEFGLLAPAGGSHEVHVIKGAVEISAKTSNRSPQTITLRAGEARRVGIRGGGGTERVALRRFFTVLPESVPIPNHSFETDENTSRGGEFEYGEARDFSNGISGWQSMDLAAYKAAVGWRGIPPAELDPYPARNDRESQALCLISGGTVVQKTFMPWSSLGVGDQLILTVSLGLRGGSPALDWNEETFFGLTDGAADLRSVELSDTVANSGLIRNNPGTGTQTGDGSFADVPFTYTVQAADLARPGRIGILLHAKGRGGASTLQNQSFLDNVRLLRRSAPSPPASR